MVAWPNPVAVFASNLADRLSGHVVPGLITTSTPDDAFWRDISICTPIPRRGLLDSVLAHVALLGLLYAISNWPGSTSHLADPLSRPALNGYNLSEYLPELQGVPTHPQDGGTHDPVLAKQQIVSLPEAPDNLRQTIVTPPQLKLQRDMSLPNIVAYEPPTPLQPLAASQRDSIRLRFPRLIPDVVGPVADTNSLQSRSRLPSFDMQVVEPAPDVAQAHPRLALPDFRPKVVEPSPDLGNPNLGSVRRGTGSNFANFAPQVAEPVPEVPNTADVQRSSRQMIALSLHPSVLQGAVEIPSGNRSGAFAASPNGQAQATGAPGMDAFAAAGARRLNAPVNAPAGISVATVAPTTPIAMPNAPTPQSGAADPNVRAKLMAAMHSPATSLPPRQPVAREATGPRSELETRIFAGRRSYTLSVNMPNLNTATGSWIIHFVEREPGSRQSRVAAPEVVSKFDPAYPGELIQDGVQGTVILRAIIRADGSVGDIAIVKSLESRLDQNAAHALSRWLFRPALRDGQAIDLEAVITVPFRTHGKF